jgi:hypothetical protein
LLKDLLQAEADLVVVGLLQAEADLVVDDHQVAVRAG